MIQLWSEMLNFDNLLWAVQALKLVESEAGTVEYVNEVSGWRIKWMHSDGKQDLAYDILLM